MFNELEALFGTTNVIVQKRVNFFAVFTFKDQDEAKKILHDLSHDPDKTFVYYSGEVLTSRQFTNEYGGYVYVPDDGYVSDEPCGNGPEETDCSNGVCSF